MARRNAGMSPLFPKVIICRRTCSVGNSNYQHNSQTFSASLAVSFALGRVVFICSCWMRDVTRFLSRP